MNFPDWTDEVIDTALAAEALRSPSPAFSDILAKDPPEAWNTLKDSLNATGTTETSKNPANMEPSTEMTRGSDALTSVDFTHTIKLLKKAEKIVAEGKAKAQATQKSLQPRLNILFPVTRSVTFPWLPAARRIVGAKLTATGKS